MIFYFYHWNPTSLGSKKIRKIECWIKSEFPKTRVTKTLSSEKFED